LENQYSSKINIIAEQHVSDKDITVSAVKEEIPETSEPPAIKVPAEELTAKTDEQDFSKEEEKRPRTSARHRYRSKKRRGAQEAPGDSALDSTVEDQSSVINSQISSLEIDALTEQLKGPISEPASGSTPNERTEGSENYQSGDTSAKEISEASEGLNVSQNLEHEADDSKTVTTEEEISIPDKDKPNNQDQEERPPQRKSFLRAYLPFFQ
jgi:hypothetical protein